MNLTKCLELTIMAKEDVRHLFQLEELLKQYIAEQIAQTKGGAKGKQRFKSAQQYIKEAIKEYPNRLQLNGSWIYNGKQYITNTFSGIELISIIEGLPEISKDVEPYKLYEIIDSAERNTHTNLKVEIPSLIDLKTQLKIAKAEMKARKVEEFQKVRSGLVKINNYFFNVKLLVDIIKLFPTEDLEYYVGNTKYSPIFVRDDIGNRAVVLPIRLIEEEYSSMV